MPYYIAEIRIKNKGGNSERKKKQKKTMLHMLAALSLIFLMVSFQTMFFSATVTASSEPSLANILNDLGFTNIAPSEVETFPSGRYNITLYAEVASYCNQNVLSYYPINTSDFQTIFDSPEGGNIGYVVPPLTKTFEVTTQFGLSLLAPGPYRYFTEHELNPDYPEPHVQVFLNLDNPDMFLIGFEDKFGGGDRDYNDMVFSLVLINPIGIGNVTMVPENPNYNQTVTVTAEVIKGTFDVESVILSYQTDSGSWTNVTMSPDDEFYVAEIPPQSYNTAVKYKIYASYTEGSSVVSELFSYTVGDFVPPVISDVVQVPSSPAPTDSVTITANVTEPLEASGIKNVTVWYTIDGGWTFTGMMNVDGLWRATIPGQSGGVNVEFFVEAFDNVGNRAITETSGYTVIIPNSPPIVSLIYSPSISYTGEVVDFNASNSYDPDGTIVSYLWDFGDGNTATGAVVTHIYPDNGEYPITITVVDNEGAVGSKMGVQVVKNRLPIAEITAAGTGVDKDEVVTYNASGSYDPDGSIVSYQWDFGDGNTATGVAVDHAYTQDGTYMVTLTVTDNDGEKDSAYTITVVINREPVALFSATPETAEIGETISFDASESYDPDGTIVSYLWDFGDGSTANGVEVDHAYSQYGVYTITLTVTDDDGATDTMSVTKSFVNKSPFASFTKSTQTAHLNEAVTFNAAESSDPDGTIVSYHWDFGDGSTANGVEANHAYSEYGVYLVTLTVTDNDGLTDSASAIVVVVNREPVATFTSTPETAETDETVTFDAAGSYDPDGTLVSYVWDFGDGNTASGVTVDHAYTQDGTYLVTLTVTDNDGYNDSVYAVTVVINREPTASFTATPETVETGEPITFNASASYDPDGSIVSYQWDFGDGNTSTGVTANHAYAEAGNYTVTLTVIDDDGTVVTASVYLQIVKSEPETALPLAILAVIALSIAALTATLLYGLLMKRKKRHA